VIPGKTGCFWSGGPQELASAVLGFDDSAVDPQACVRNAARFDVANFRHGIRLEVRAARAGADELTPALSSARTTELLANPASGSRR
jgi:hypothetical protein